MKSLQFLAVSLAIFCFCTGCAPKSLPPELKPSYTANEVLIRVQELQRTTIHLYESRGISKEDADNVVRFTVSSASIIQNTPLGWQATIRESWSQLNKVYHPTDEKLQIAWNMMAAMIGSLN